MKGRDWSQRRLEPQELKSGRTEGGWFIQRFSSARDLRKMRTSGGQVPSLDVELHILQGRETPPRGGGQGGRRGRGILGGLL